MALGQHIVPEDYEPAVDALDENKVSQALEEMRLARLRVAQQLPSHAEFLASTAPAPPPPTTFSFTDEVPTLMPFTSTNS